MKFDYENDKELGHTVDIVFEKIIISISIAHWIFLKFSFEKNDSFVQIGCVTIGQR